MAQRKVTKEALRAMARMSGLELNDDRLEELLPQVQRSMEALGGLEVLDLENVEPAVVFAPEEQE
jgi:Asp-tRNA(Asn)/Glu-tRNA(Gln) amidotransferase C subunit